MRPSPVAVLWTERMAQCVKCASETQLYDRGVPICPACIDSLDAKATEATVPESGRFDENPTFGAGRDIGGNNSKTRKAI